LNPLHPSPLQFYLFVLQKTLYLLPLTFITDN
jgi:hypothetical protein